nr:hypothetical protein CFP56_45782 [Quercus suber]
MGDGLRGPSAKNTMAQPVRPGKKLSVDTQGDNQTQPINEPLPSADHQNFSNMDSAENMDKPKQISRQNLFLNPQVINHIPIISTSLHPKDFESQIEEIDTTLKKFEFHDFNAPSMTAGTLTYADSSGDNLGIIMDKLDSGENQNSAHVAGQTLATILDTTELRKWKKLARSISKANTDIQFLNSNKTGKGGR